MNLVANGNKSKHKKPKKNLVLFGTIFTFPRIWQFLKHYKLGHFIKHKALISDEWFTYHVYWILSWMQKTTIKFWKLAGFLMAEYYTVFVFKPKSSSLTDIWHQLQCSRMQREHSKYTLGSFRLYEVNVI